jgi:hypothetical protein
MVPPRFATARNPERRTMGGAVAKVAELLGQPLMPWQRYVADVAGEVDHRGRYVHPLVVVSVPRQSGKTTLMLAQGLQRALQGPARKVWHTAQSGRHANEKQREFVELVARSPLKDVCGKPRMAAGSMSLPLMNGSTLKPHPPLRDSLHGEQGDHNDIDEGWSFDEEHGAALFQAIGPTHATRPGAQTFVWSTRGDAASTWFHRLVDRGYEGAGVALFDWGIPYDGDPTDLDLIVRHHPAVGHTIEREFLAGEQRSMADEPAEYARAYGNVPTGGTETIIPAAAWNAARTTEPLPPGMVTYGVAVSLDGDSGALVAAVPDEHGRPWVEVIEHRPGRSWLIDRVKALKDHGGGVAVDRRGPAGAVADALELAGVPLLTPTTFDYAAGCQELFDRVIDADGPRFIHRASDQLDAAVNVAGRKRLEEGGWVWSRKRSTGDIATLEAATLAAWAAARAPEPVTIGPVYFR